MGAKAFAAVLMATAVLPGAAPALGDGVRVRVLQRELLGRYIEDVDFVPPGSGPFSNHIVMLNGFEVHGLPVNAGSDAAIRKLFDLRGQILLQNPTGVAFVASEGLFAFVDSEQRTQLFFTDGHGGLRPPRPIRFLNGYVPDHIEGLAYLPPTSPRYPDHLLTLTWKLFSGFPIIANRLHVIRRDGQVVAEIPLPFGGLLSGYFSVTFLAPDRLLVTKDDGTIGRIDFDGNMPGCEDDPSMCEVETGTLVEGLVQLADGRVVTGAGSQLRFYDEVLNRLPLDDRDAGTPIGLAQPLSIAWNPDRLHHLVVANADEFVDGEVFLQAAAVPLALDSSSPVISLDEVRFRAPKATYIPAEHLTAVALRRIGGSHPQPAQIALYDADAVLVETIDASAIGGTGLPGEIAYIPPTGEFVVVEPSRPSTLKFLTRSGALAREVDLAPTGIDRIFTLAYFNPDHPSGGQFLVFGPLGRAVITDFDGNAMGGFDYRAEMGLMEVGAASAITNGPQAGAFTAVELASSASLVVFKLE